MHHKNIESCEFKDMYEIINHEEVNVSLYYFIICLFPEVINILEIVLINTELIHIVSHTCTFRK